MWTFEFYRILTAQRMAQYLLEAKHSRLIAQTSRDDGETTRACPFPWGIRALLRESRLLLMRALMGS